MTIFDQILTPTNVYRYPLDTHYSGGRAHEK
jgi:hypothetical protein